MCSVLLVYIVLSVKRSPFLCQQVINVISYDTAVTGYPNESDLLAKFRHHSVDGGSETIFSRRTHRRGCIEKAASSNCVRLNDFDVFILKNKR